MTINLPQFKDTWEVSAPSVKTKVRQSILLELAQISVPHADIEDGKKLKYVCIE